MSIVEKKGGGGGGGGLVVSPALITISANALHLMAKFLAVPSLFFAHCTTLKNVTTTRAPYYQLAEGLGTRFW